jgi:hypothetical protein|tara:strand:- start:4492 stop:4674 length:183 start_codon:yes stop_codon:yes gene_type:complete
MSIFINQQSEVFIMDAASVTAVTNSVDFATIITGIGAIGAAVAVVYVAMKGVRLLLSALR